MRTFVLFVCVLAASLLSAPDEFFQLHPERLDFVVALQQQHLDQIDALWHAVGDPDDPRFNQFLSKEEINRIVRPKQADIDHLFTIAKQVGVHISFSEDETFAFYRNLNQVQLDRLRELLASHPNYAFSFSSQEVFVPKERLEREKHRMTIHTLQGGGDGPLEQRKLYGIPNDVKGHLADNFTQMVWGTGTFGYSSEDLSSFYSTFNVDNDVSNVRAKGHKGDPSGANFGEGTLDTQYISGIATNTNTQVFNSNNSATTEFSYGFGYAMLEFTKAFNQGTNPPLILSISLGSLSFGSCNLLCTEAAKHGITKEQCLAYAGKQFQVCMYDNAAITDIMSMEYAKMGLRGVTIFVASGDGGNHFSFGPFPKDSIGNVLNAISCENSFPTFPCSSPYVVAVGGTMRSSDGIQYCGSQDGCVVSGGAGFGIQFAQPKYQQEAVAAYLDNAQFGFKFNASNRAYPDISAIANNVPIVVKGRIQAIGGTSASAPEMAAMFSLLLSERLRKGMPPLGQIHTRLYRYATQSPDLFEDVTVGNTKCGYNGCCESGFPAGPGWDAATGLGQPKWDGLKAHFLQ